MYGTPEYKAWQGAHQRVSNPNATDYKHYGGRGISMAPEWVGPGGFERFYAELGPKPDSYSLDRIDVNGNYEPGNCRWADWSTQLANRRPWARLEREVA
jgi:hypothetical protein